MHNAHPVVPTPDRIVNERTCFTVDERVVDTYNGKNRVVMGQILKKFLSVFIIILQ